MSALFNINSLFMVSILFVCTCTYIKWMMPSLITNRSKGAYSIFYKASVIGERMSIYVSIISVFYGLFMAKKLIFG